MARVARGGWNVFSNGIRLDLLGPRQRWLGSINMMRSIFPPRTAMPHLLPYKVTWLSSFCPPLPWRREVVDATVGLQHPASHFAAVMTINRVTSRAAPGRGILQPPFSSSSSSASFPSPTPSSPEQRRWWHSASSTSALLVTWHTIGGQKERKKKILQRMRVLPLALRNSPSSDKWRELQRNNRGRRWSDWQPCFARP